VIANKVLLSLEVDVQELDGILEISQSVIIVLSINWGPSEGSFANDKDVLPEG